MSLVSGILTTRKNRTIGEQFNQLTLENIRGRAAAPFSLINITPLGATNSL